MQRRPADVDESVVLFVLMKPGKKFSQRLVNEIKAAIRKELSPRHVPKYIFETPEIPVSLTSTDPRGPPGFEADCFGFRQRSISKRSNCL